MSHSMYGYRWSCASNSSYNDFTIVKNDRFILELLAGKYRKVSFELAKGR